MPVNAIFVETEKLMKKTLDRLHNDFGAVRTGRPSITILDPVRVNFYGSLVPVNQVGTVAVTEGKTIEVRPWDVSVLPELEKAVNGANLGITPHSDGKVMRLTFPPLSEERRKDLVKIVKKLAEEFRVSLRNERRDAMEKVKKEKEAGLSEDVQKQAETKIQAITNAYIKKVDDKLAEKEKEVMEI